MFNVDAYMGDMIAALHENFEGRLLYVGLQGSYLRGEATQNSDIDVVVIIEGLSPEDLSVYKGIITALDMPEKSCGFICGREEMGKWNALEICNFLHGTKDYYGKIADFLPGFTREDVENFVRLSVGNLYHEICHRYVHADMQKNKTKLPYAYKNVFFILQSVYYLRTGTFYPTKKELMSSLSGNDAEVMKRATCLLDQEDYNFEEEFSFLLAWCQETLRTL